MVLLSKILTYKIREDKFKLCVFQFSHEVEGLRGASKFLDTKILEAKNSTIVNSLTECACLVVTDVTVL